MKLLDHENKFPSIFILMLCAGNVVAQQKVLPSGLLHLKKMADRYSQNSFLGFSMNIRFSAESAPHNYLDSMKGAARISGNRYWYSMGNTELINTGDYMISLFSEEKIMQLIRQKTTDNRTSMEAVGISQTLINSLDSMQQKELVSISTEEASDHYKVTILFKNHPSWKSISYVIRRVDDLLERTVIVAKMEEMLGPGLQGMNLAEGYAIIESIFSGYSIQKFETGTLRSEHYFTRKGEEYEPVAAFREYRIMMVQ